MITLNNVVIGHQGKPVVSPVSGRFEPHTLTAIIGANGTGKSTLLKTLAGLLPPLTGELMFAERVKPHIGYLPQQADIDRQFPVNVLDVAAMGCWPKIGFLRSINRIARQRIHQAIERVGLTSIQRQPIEALSGGQFQRLMFARLLVQDAPLMLLDEPFTGIDGETCSLLMDVIKQLHAEGRTLIVVLHNLELVQHHFPHTLCLASSDIRWGDTREVIPRAWADPAMSLAGSPMLQGAS